MNYIAFLRGINVGGRKILKEDLVEVFESLGFDSVKTVIQSGNVIFESENQDLDKLTDIIESGLTEKFKYKAKVVVVAKLELEQVIDHYPFKSEKSQDWHDYVAFLSKNIVKEIVKSVEISDHEKFETGNNLIYWRVRKGMSLDSNLAKVLSMSKYKDFNTVRNLNTLEKIVKV
jgi:uncharacterized protein (DUF1697 family)